MCSSTLRLAPTQRESVRSKRLYVAAVAIAWLSACGAPAGFLPHAAMGQLELYRAARPIEEILADERTPESVRELLREVPRIKAYALRQGLSISDNYEDFVALNRPYVVWFVNASHPLAFNPKTFWFPVVGAFPGLGWFDEKRAKQHAASLDREGWDVNVRGVRAFSTGGWFSDPIVSSMLTESDYAVSYLVNVILHESVHATILVKNQQFYNESLASFVGDTMTAQYLNARYGKSSPIVAVYQERELRRAEAEQLLAKEYRALEVLYASDVDVAEKLLQKQKIMRELYVRLGFEDLPNNATLIGTRLYDMGKPEFSQLLDTCKGDWPRFIAATASVRPKDFASAQLEDFTPVVIALGKRGCEPFAPPRSSRYRFP